MSRKDFSHIHVLFELDGFGWVPSGWTRVARRNPFTWLEMREWQWRISSEVAELLTPSEALHQEKLKFQEIPSIDVDNLRIGMDLFIAKEWEKLVRQFQVTDVTPDAIFLNVLSGTTPWNKWVIFSITKSSFSHPKPTLRTMQTWSDGKIKRQYREIRFYTPAV